MIKKVLLGIIVCVFSISGAKYHQDSRGAEIHTPFRWIVADSTAKAALSLSATDTGKFCFQLSDTSIWCLIDNSPLKWAFISGKKVDSLKVRSLDADSVTIPVFKGNETHRGNIGVGAAALPTWINGYNFLSLNGYSTLFGASYSVGGTGAYGQAGLANNTRIGTSFFPYAIGNGKGAYIVLGSGKMVFATADSVAAGSQQTFTNKFVVDENGACTTSTINTGNGNCEVYPTISGTFSCTLKTNDVTVQQIGTAYWTKSKDVFICSMPRIVGTSNSTLLKIYCKFPYNPKQLSGSTPDDGCFVLASDNNQPYMAYVEVPEYLGYIQINMDKGAFTNSGTKGVYAPFTVKYITEN